MSSTVQGTGHPMMNKTDLVPPIKLIAEHIKKPSGGFLKCLCTAPLAWVSLKLAVTVSRAQEGPGGSTSDSLICKHQETGELCTTIKGCQLDWVHPCPYPTTASPAVPTYRYRLVGLELGLENLWRWSPEASLWHPHLELPNLANKNIRHWVKSEFHINSEQFFSIGIRRRGHQREDKMVGWHHQLSGHEMWANSRRQWKTEKPGVLQFMGSQRIRDNWATEQQQQ